MRREHKGNFEGYYLTTNDFWLIVILAFTLGMLVGTVLAGLLLLLG